MFDFVHGKLKNDFIFRIAMHVLVEQHPVKHGWLLKQKCEKLQRFKIQLKWTFRYVTQLCMQFLRLTFIIRNPATSMDLPTNARACRYRWAILIHLPFTLGGYIGLSRASCPLIIPFSLIIMTSPSIEVISWAWNTAIVSDAIQHGFNSSQTTLSNGTYFNQHQNSNHRGQNMLGNIFDLAGQRWMII